MDPCVEEIYEASYATRHPSQLVRRISKLHMVMMTPYFVIHQKHEKAADCDIGPDWADTSPAYPQLAHFLLIFLKKERPNTGMEGLLSFVIDLIKTFMVRSGYYKPLINLCLEVMNTTRPLTSESDQTGPMAKYYSRLIPTISSYLDVRFISCINE